MDVHCTVWISYMLYTYLVYFWERGWHNFQNCMYAKLCWHYTSSYIAAAWHQQHYKDPCWRISSSMGTDQNTQTLSICNPSSHPSILVKTILTFVIVYFCPQRRFKKCVNIGPSKVASWRPGSRVLLNREIFSIFYKSIKHNILHNQRILGQCIILKKTEFKLVWNALSMKYCQLFITV